MTDQEKITKAKQDFESNYSGLSGLLAKLMIFERFAKIVLRMYSPKSIETFQDQCLSEKLYHTDRFYLWYYKDQLESK